MGIEKITDENERKRATGLHTATHLLQAALRRLLGPEVKQTGSDITAERLRFDFTFPRKLTIEELKRVEDLVNEKIGEDLRVSVEEMPHEKALANGALAFFKAKYPSIVKVYTIGIDPSTDSTGSPQAGSRHGRGSPEAAGSAFSREVCGGPHVESTGQVGHFCILKEESVAAGIRRIRATVE